MINYADEIEKETAQQWNVHDRHKTKTLEELQGITQKDRLPFSVCLLNSTGDLNIGTTIRSAHLLGADSVILYGRRKYDKRSTVGADQYFPVERITGFLDDETTFDVERFWSTMNERNLYPMFVETEGVPLHQFPWEGYLLDLAGRGMKVCLVFGNETTGIPLELITKDIDHHGYLHPMISIPQSGVLRSYNLSAAASIVMWELRKELRLLQRR